MKRARHPLKSEKIQLLNKGTFTIITLNELTQKFIFCFYLFKIFVNADTIK